MHYYVCPYCEEASEKSSKLVKIKLMDIPCEHKKGLFFDEYRECGKEKYKCKEVLECDGCESLFKISIGFLRKQKRKIKNK